MEADKKGSSQYDSKETAGHMSSGLAYANKDLRDNRDLDMFDEYY